MNKSLKRRIERSEVEGGTPRRIPRRESAAGCSSSNQSAEVPKVAGRVMAVEMEDFMCHRRLRAQFEVASNNCFFVGGSNGSGKSALLAALNIGLGGTGCMNERGGSLKEYIKTGERMARISISLSNEGEGRREEYGEVVKVERTLLLNSSAFRIKSVESGVEKVVSRHKKDVDLLLKAFDIQLRNPIFWMTQDRCRTFLQDQKPENLYEAFSQAMSLDTIDALYTSTSGQLSDAKEYERHAAEDLHKTHAECKRMQARLASEETLTKKKEQLGGLKWMESWVPYRDAMEVLTKRGRDLERISLAMQKRQERLDRNEEQYAAVSEEKERIQESYNDINNRIKELEREVTAKKQESAVCLNEAKMSRVGLANAENDLKEEQKTLTAFEDILEADVANQDQNKREAEAKRLQDESERVERKLEELKGPCQELEKAFAKCESTMKAKAPECTMLRENETNGIEECRSLRSEVERMERMQQKGASRFGYKTDEILALIERNEQRFRKKVEGPIGSKVRVLDERYAVGVETALKSMLSAFVCDNQQDTRLLKDLLRRNNIPIPTIVTSKFTDKRYNTTRNEPAANLPTVLRTIEVEGVNAFNALVDQCRIESILLFENSQQARDVMFKNPPKNGLKGYTADGGMVLPTTPNRPYRFYAAGRPGQNLFAKSQTVDPKRLETVKAKLAEVEKALVPTKAKNAEAKEEWRILAHDKREVNRRLEETTQEVEDLEAERRRIHRALNDGVAQPGSSDKLKKRIEECKAKMTDWENKIAEAKEEYAERRDKYRTAMEELDQTQKQLVEARAEVESKETELHENHRQLEVAETERMNLRMLIGRLQTQRVEVEASLEAAKTRSESEHERAIKCEDYKCPAGQMNPPDLEQLPETETLVHRIAAIQKEIRAIETAAVGGAPVTIEILNATKMNVEQRRERIAKQRVVRMKAKEAMKMRFKEILSKRVAMGERLGNDFAELLSARRFRGSLTIDNQKRTIAFTVEPMGREGNSYLDSSSSSTFENHPITAQNCQSLKGLSGGERTYTVAAYIMALWKQMEAPFRCMDEFDVFLDMNSRKLVMELLIDLATRRFPEKQFIFFTPLGFSDLGRHDRVQVLELTKDPGV